MPPQIATTSQVDRAGMLEFVRPRHHAILITTRSDGTPQASPVTCGVAPGGRVAVATYPERAKTLNVRRTGTASLVVLSNDFSGPWIQVDGDAQVLDMPEALEPLVEYYRCISGEHPDWAEYRAAMQRQAKSLILITPRHWGPVATGGFPARLGSAPTVPHPRNR
jgi:PPOX class probable F420-dependent enzyme